VIGASAAGSLNWHTNDDRVSADIKGASLLQVLSQIAGATGWHVYVEPDAGLSISVKFSDLPQGEALHRLLGDLNFALIPSTNSYSKLFVFHTSARNATRLVPPSQGGDGHRKPKVIPNELIVRLKPGMKIEDLARQLGAKVIGRLDGLNAYRLQFDDATAAAAAAAQLSSNSDVASVENNYTMDRPEPLQVAPVQAGQIHLQVAPPPANGAITVGLVDTAIQPLGNGLDAFLLKAISVAGDAQPDPNTPTHGTAMAETMLSIFQLLENGQSPIRILPVDVYGPNQSTTTFDMAVGIQTAFNKGANPISVSSGTTGDSQVLSDLIASINQNGGVVYAAKGNDGPGTDKVYPAAYQGVTAVTALGSNGQPTSYANLAPIPAVGASGTSLVPFGSQSYVVQGTSPATAIASATASVIAQKGSISATAANVQLWGNPTPTTIPNK
jgi:hypothetical protein